MNKYLMIDRNEIFYQEIINAYGRNWTEADMRQYKVLDQYASGEYIIYDEQFGCKCVPVEMMESITPHCEVKVEGGRKGCLSTAFVSQKYAERMALFNQLLSGDVVITPADSTPPEDFIVSCFTVTDTGEEYWSGDFDFEGSEAEVREYCKAASSELPDDVGYTTKWYYQEA